MKRNRKQAWIGLRGEHAIVDQEWDDFDYHEARERFRRRRNKEWR